eukprot:m.722001 g.722001  ORF g.722001 m.722001 type:complete len:64 (+) comp23015_c0_seq1:328-519(+)
MDALYGNNNIETVCHETQRSIKRVPCLNRIILTIHDDGTRFGMRRIALVINVTLPCVQGSLPY